MIEKQKTVKYWFGLTLIVLLFFLLFGSPSRLGHLVLFLWAVTGFGVYYRTRFEETSFGKKWIKSAILIIGIVSVIYSLVSIPFGWSNPPFSLDELALLFCGITLIYFGLKGWASLILPSLIPLIFILGYQFVGESPEQLTDPLVPFTAKVSVVLIRLFAVDALLEGNIISYLSLNGDPIRLSIIPACTGVWSMSAFIVAVFMMLIIFPDIGRRGYAFFVLGALGTWISNLGRVLIIALSGYIYGYGGLLQIVHIHAGWVAFSIWMLIFWYVFFSLKLHHEKLGP
ncbi:archaeosortase/exosortase family protein [Candidatus Altiarchaeota archaeon]